MLRLLSWSSRRGRKNMASLFATQNVRIGNSARYFSSESKQDGPTGVVMLNMGGPATDEEVGPFLQNLFSDGEIIQLGKLQNILGPFIAKRRTPEIRKQYKEIGGSPIRKWTNMQGTEMCKILDNISPETAPHKHYTCFRYANPLTEEALTQMKEDGVTRAVAFSQYPQFSCTTAGSSFNHLWRELDRLDLKNDFTWSLIDRWPTHPTFIKAVANRIALGLADIPDAEREDAVILFSAHSLPHKVVNKGDQYVQEVAATVQAVMSEIGYSHAYILAWQSQVGYLPWMGPQTGEVLEGLGKQGHKTVLTVPIAFTSDHIETLYEIDIEYAHVAKEAGIDNIYRAPSLNDEPLLAQAQAELVADHLASGATSSKQYRIRCAQCVNPDCRNIVNPVKDYTRHIDYSSYDASL